MIFGGTNFIQFCVLLIGAFGFKLSEVTIGWSPITTQQRTVTFGGFITPSRIWIHGARGTFSRGHTFCFDVVEPFAVTTRFGPDPPLAVENSLRSDLGLVS